MPQGFSGLRAETPDNLVLDAGMLWANIDVEALVAETNGGYEAAIAEAINLGATRGASNFNANRTLRQIEVNGSLGAVSKLTRRQEVRPTLSTTLLEITPGNVARAFAGAVAVQEGEYEVISGGEITEESFLTNVALATRYKGAPASKPAVLVVHNAMVHTSPPLNAEEQNEMGMEMEFVGHFPLDDPQNEMKVWTLYIPILNPGE